jgi:hypothetical protein
MNSSSPPWTDRRPSIIGHLDHLLSATVLVYIFGRRKVAPIYK